MNDTIKNALANFHNDESGATATEYIILLILIACFVIGVVQVFGETVSEKYGAAEETISDRVTF